jgi:hypothetical protein
MADEDLSRILFLKNLNFLALFLGLSLVEGSEPLPLELVDHVVDVLPLHCSEDYSLLLGRLHAD